MKKAIIAVALMLLASTSFATTRIIPVAGHTPGGNNTVWTTDVTLKNNDASVATVTLQFRAEDGSSFSRDVTVPAGQSLLLQDAANPFLYQGSGRSDWLGQLEIKSSSNISANADIHTTTAGGGTLGSSYGSFDPGVLSAHGAVGALLSSARYRSNVAFANASDSGVSVDLLLRTSTGAIASTLRIDVAAHRTVQMPVAAIITTPDDSPLMLEWSASAPIYVVGSVVDNASGDPTTTPSFAGGTTSLFFPVVGRTTGGLGTFWSTAATISSLSDSTGSLTFIYTTSDGLLYSATVTIPPHGSVRAPDVNSLVGAPAGSGALRVDATVKIIGTARVFNTQPNGSTYGSSVLPQESSTRGTRVRIHGVRRDADHRLNVALSNETETVADGIIHLTDSRNREVETTAFHLNGKNSTQISLNKTSDIVAGGDVEVVISNDIPLTVVASIVDNRSGDTLLTEVEQENERETAIDIRPPATITAGSVASFTIAASESAIKSVAWRFGDGGTATGLAVSHVYANAGEYEVSADVTLVGDAVVHEREDVHVLLNGNTNNGIDFDWTPSTALPGQFIVFEVTTETTQGGTYKWKFPDGSTKTGSVVTHSFGTNGTFEVELELEREGVITKRMTHTLKIGSTATTGATFLDFTWSPAAPKAGQAVSFTTAYNDPPVPGYVVKWRFPNDARPEGSPVSYTFSAPGTYTVRVELEQPGRPSIQKEKDVTVTQ